MKDFQQIFQAFTPVVYRYLLSLCADEDLAQELTAETFYQAYLHLGTFRGDCKPETWLCQIAKRALWKEQKRRRRTVSPESLAEVPAEERLLEALSDKEQALRLHRHLHALSEPYREVFMLRVLGELSFREIAAICGKTESWAKVTFYRAKNKLLEKMEDQI